MKTMLFTACIEASFVHDFRAREICFLVSVVRRKYINKYEFLHDKFCFFASAAKRCLPVHERRYGNGVHS
jgi:hypothetical protein